MPDEPRPRGPEWFELLARSVEAIAKLGIAAAITFTFMWLALRHVLGADPAFAQIVWATVTNLMFMVTGYLFGKREAASRTPEE